MKDFLRTLLACPACGETPACTAWQSGSGEVTEGMLVCPCGEAFPIIGGVPRMLLAPFREQLCQQYPAFFDAHRKKLAPCLLPQGRQPRGEASSAELRTQRSFGFEWNRFS